MYEDGKTYSGTLISPEELIGERRKFRMVKDRMRVAYLYRLFEYIGSRIAVTYDEEKDLFWFGEVMLVPSWLSDVEETHIRH